MSDPAELTLKDLASAIRRRKGEANPWGVGATMDDWRGMSKRAPFLAFWPGLPSVVCAEIVMACEASTFAISWMVRMYAM